MCIVRCKEVRIAVCQPSSDLVPMRLDNAPLVHVLAQVVFSPVLRFEERLDAFREAIHGAGFPWVKQGFLHEVMVVAGHEAVPVPSVTVRPRLDYLSPDRRTGVTLTERTIALQTTAYTSSTPFWEQLGHVVSVCGNVFGPELIERIGLRFTDVVRVRRGERFSEYVQPGLLGFAWRDVPELEARGIGLRTETLAQTPYGAFMVRSAVLPPKQVVPPDLLPTLLAFPEIPEDVAEQPSLALDFDHFVELNEAPFNATPMLYSADGVVNVIRQLHSGHRAVFEAAATRHAFARWGPWIE